jgi:hypothetical protein
MIHIGKNFKLFLNIKKNPDLARDNTSDAEREGFEPPLAFTKTVFKTAAFNRSAISPKNSN